MATQKPRITVTITPQQHTVLRSLSDSTGQPMSAFLTELLEASLPTLERMAVTFHKLKQAQNVERDRYLQSMDETQAVLEDIAQQATSQLDMFLTVVEQSTDPNPVPAKRARVGVGAAVSAPATNRGATDPLAGRRKPKRSKAVEVFSNSSVLKKTAATTGHKKRGAA